jgi:hypothetical protein
VFGSEILDMTARLLGRSSVLSRTKAPVTADSDVDKPEDGTLWIVEIAGHVWSHRYAIHRLVGSVIRWAGRLLAGGSTAGAGSQRRSMRGWGRRIYD